MSRPAQPREDYPLGTLIEVYCREDCMARRKDDGCKLIDGDG